MSGQYIESFDILHVRENNNTRAYLIAAWRITENEEEILYLLPYGKKWNRIAFKNIEYASIFSFPLDSKKNPFLVYRDGKISYYKD